DPDSHPLLYLRRLLRLYPIHIIAVHPHPDAVPHLDTQAFLFHFIDDGLNTTAGDNAIAFFQIGEHLLHFLALFLLWPKNHDLENRNQGQEQKNGVEQFTYTASRLWPRRICNVSPHSLTPPYMQR